jgi:FkbM family methyltransferase
MTPNPGPRQAQCHRGVYLPAGERHLVDMLSSGAKRYAELPDGRPAYQRHKYLAALEVVPLGRFGVFVDIGGHCGLWGMQAEQDFARVQAFEPHPVHAEIYPWNMRTTRYEVHEVALGAAPARADVVNRTPGSSGDTHIALDAEGAVEVRTLDSFNLPADVIKIDTEGGELAVCQGGLETIRRACLVIVEQKGHDAALGGARNGALTFLTELGMVAKRAPISGDHFLGWPQ